MPDTSPDLYDCKLNKINGVSARKTQQTVIYFIATSDIHITMNLILPIRVNSSQRRQRGASVSRHRMSTENEKNVQKE